MKKYPAQIRYEKKHPVVSFRLDRDLKERLKNVLEDKSFADFVKEGLGVREREKESLKDEYRKGYDDAIEKFGVYYPCSICGERKLVTAPKLKKRLSKCIQSWGWGHAECIDKDEEDRRKRRREFRELWR